MTTLTTPLAGESSVAVITRVPEALAGETAGSDVLYAIGERLDRCFDLRQSEIRRTRNGEVQAALDQRLGFLTEQDTGWWQFQIHRSADWLMDGFKADPAAWDEYERWLLHRRDGMRDEEVFDAS